MAQLSETVFHGSKEDLIIRPDPDLSDIIPDFLMRRQEDIAQARESLSNNDFQKLKEMAHTVKGISRPYGFNYLETLAINLEIAAKAFDLDRCKEIIDEIDYYVQNIKIVN